MIPHSKDWEIDSTGIETDHQMVSVRISDAQMPYVGKGRLTMPHFLLKDHKLTTQVKRMGQKLQQDIDSCRDSRTEEHNPQIVY